MGRTHLPRVVYMIGETFGNYRIVSQVGSGAMGTVFLAEHERIARRAAIKVLAPELARNPDILRRFFVEARATSVIQHPGIVEVLDCGLHPTGRPYIVMEYLEGETLDRRIECAGPLHWERACATAASVAEALAAAHQRGIVHRDVKPANVMLLADAGEERARCRLKVLDFGIAKLLHESQSMASTHPGKLLGTPEYMAPEQCDGSGAVDERSDIYALGCVLFEMVSGQPPFAGEKLSDFIIAHRSAPAPSASARAPGLPPALDGLIARMLSKRPSQRPRDMGEVERVLRDLTERISSRTTVVRPLAAPRRPPRWAAVAAAAWVVALAGALSIYGAHRALRARPQGEPALAPVPAASNGSSIHASGRARPPEAVEARRAEVARQPESLLEGRRMGAAADRRAHAGPVDRKSPARPRPAPAARAGAAKDLDLDGIVDL